jgi:hypothetical protein
MVKTRAKVVHQLQRMQRSVAPRCELTLVAGVARPWLCDGETSSLQLAEAVCSWRWLSSLQDSSNTAEAYRIDPAAVAHTVLLCFPAFTRIAVCVGVPAGIICKSNMLYVHCCCTKCSRPAAGAAAAAGGSSSTIYKLFGLEDWVEQHAKGPVIPSDDDAEAERLVRSTVLASSSGWDAQVRNGPSVHGDSSCCLQEQA